MSIPSLTYEKKKNSKLKEKMKESTGRHFHEDAGTDDDGYGLGQFITWLVALCYSTNCEIISLNVFL